MFDVFCAYWWQMLIVMIASYLVGNVNFAVIFSRLFKLKDVRNYGSGNPGTTNMFRVFGLRMGALTFVCDALKGVLCCLVAKYSMLSLGEQASLDASYLAGLFVVLGHVFPAFFRFRGGKGVATSIGVCFSLQPILSLCCVLPLVVIILITDRMSVMSLVLSVFMIVWSWTMLRIDIGLFCCLCVTLMFVAVIFAHRHNVVRLCTGKEHPTGVRKAFRGKSDKIVK